MVQTTMLSLMAVALVFPSTLALALPFDFYSFRNIDNTPWGKRPHPQPYYPTYTLTAPFVGAIPTSGVFGATGTGTAVCPTATGYAKRDVEKRDPYFGHHHGYPTAFPTGTGLPFAQPTGHYDHHAEHFDFGFSYEKRDADAEPIEWKGRWGGPRKGPKEHFHWSHTWSTGGAPTATGTTGPTGTAAPYPTAT